MSSRTSYTTIQISSWILKTTRKHRYHFIACYDAVSASPQTSIDYALIHEGFTGARNMRILKWKWTKESLLCSPLLSSTARLLSSSPYSLHAPDKKIKWDETTLWLFCEVFDFAAGVLLCTLNLLRISLQTQPQKTPCSTQKSSMLSIFDLITRSNDTSSPPISQRAVMTWACQKRRPLD